jgi:hypothetical protein
MIRVSLCKTFAAGDEEGGELGDETLVALRKQASQLRKASFVPWRHWAVKVDQVPKLVHAP